ncbi:phage tail protein [Collinsella sp. AM17-1]|uniref:phage tail protein n=1 Tax=Collinsella sp. AM17-1 TaxID=2292027 RepID=UPI000E4B34E8|nr:phage tail protein [Collinsella sp. AM17-1]RHH73021.1 hypothetical protein DW195_02795 [Collinsella sp. AM17-1]
MRIDVYTWQDAYVSTIGPEELLSLTHTDELNGEDSVDIVTTFALKQGYRLVWADRLGKVHEHVCQDPKGLHAGGDTVYTDTAINSICETYGDYIEDKRPYGYGFLQALNVCLGPTRWTAGTVDRTGTVDKGLTFYHTSAREALQSILECGGELETEITVSGGKVTSRRVGIRSHRGAKGGHRRFTYTKDLASVSRTEHYGAITACYGYGKGIETDTGGYGRKLTFGDINNGKNYVEDATALGLYGRPDGRGGRAHVFGQYENSNCEDAATLLAETRAYLDSRKEPGMTYEADAVDLMQFGRDWEGVAVGDDVQIVDTAFSPALRCEGRVTKLVTDQLGGTVRVTLGNVTETIADMWLAQQQKLSSLSKRSSSWDVAASTPPSYLQQVMDSMNVQFNLAGNSYVHTSFERGLIFGSVPLDADGRSTTGDGMAMQLCSQGFRIAGGCKADGSWDWRTFGTGKGFFAEFICFGTMLGDLIKAGTIQDRSGKNYWNLDESEVHLGPGAKLDGKDIATTNAVVKSTVKLYAKNQSDTVPPLNMQNPELGWSEDIPEWENGYFIWEMDRITYGDGSVNHSSPVLVAALNKANQSAYDLNQSLRDLDTTVNDLAKDGVVTEAEAAAVKKAKQDVDKEREEMTSQFNALKSNKALSAQFLSSVLGPRYTKAFGTTDEGGTYGAYADKVDKVLKCKTAEELKAVMYEYDAAYGAYSSAVKDYADAATGARHAIEQENAKDYADGILSAYDEQMDQKAIFDRLTNGGAEQGLYMSNNRVYLNASYVATGTIADAKGRNTWNLKEGVLTTNYMTAKNITASGTFTCGNSSCYTMLNGYGQMEGYRKKGSASSPSRVGYIDFSTSVRDIPTNTTLYGLQFQADGAVRISSPSLSVKASSDTSETTTTGLTGEKSIRYMSDFKELDDGRLRFYYTTGNIHFINGFCTSCSL